MVNLFRKNYYGAIYADPPWSFQNWSAKGEGRNPSRHYRCLSFPLLAELNVTLRQTTALCFFGRATRCCRSRWN
jgi:hypothetical protein